MTDRLVPGKSAHALRKRLWSYCLFLEKQTSHCELTEQKSAEAQSLDCYYPAGAHARIFAIKIKIKRKGRNCLL